MKTQNIIISLVIPFVLANCGSMKDRYDVISKNEGVLPLEDVSIIYGGMDFGGGYLSPGRSATYSFAGEEAPIPERAKAVWVRVKDGKKFEKEVEVKSQLPKGRFKGDIIFLFNNDDLSVTWERD